MSGVNWWAIAPLLVLSGGAVLLMLLVAARRDTPLSWITTALILAAAALSCLPAREAIPQAVTPLLMADSYALFFTALFAICGLVTVIVSHEYLGERHGENEEFFLLVLLSTLGAVTLAYANHFVALLLGMELMGVSLYALIGYPDKLELPLEAAIKYLVLSAAASITFVFGFALLYAAVGVLDYPGIGAALASADNPVLLASAAMIVAGLGYKLSVVPFHMWTPDVYEGAPAPITGFLAAVSKGAIFAALLRWWMASGLYELPGLLTLVALVAGASMLVGNLLALLQDNIKRVLAYSSIAHMGYLLIVLVACGLVADPHLAKEAAAYYLVAYSLTSLAAFTLLGLLSRASGSKELASLDDLTGLFWRQPGLSLLFTVALLSLAGIPLTAGFVGKFYLFSAGVAGSLWGLLALLVIGSAIGLYYYLRMVYRMTLAGDAQPAAVERPGWPARLTCYGLVLAMLYLGIVPGPLMEILRTIL
ncbi:MAG: NADH-quinone oxidoreductase subunit N [Halieaceae bacterium]|nr:NADH-quinone oxidoreductase subunit N [Halieaceae bacterium]